MTFTLLVVFAVILSAFLILGIISRRTAQRIAAMRKDAPASEPVWMGVIKRGARLFRSRFRYFRPGPQVPTWTSKVKRPLRAALGWLLDVVPELAWGSR
jgi:hypothetical protein